MDSNKIHPLINGIKNIGDQINQWRNDESLKKIREPKQFKTEADFKANFLLKNLISSLDSKAEIISEEDSVFLEDMPTSYWLIDPIDGTASWYEGFEGFVTQVSLVNDGEPILGVIHAPALNKIWWGYKDHGSYLNGKKIVNRKNHFFNDGFKLIDNYPKPSNIAKSIAEGMCVSEYIESGSLGLKSVLVADGTADLFVKDVIIRDWDIAPAYVLLKELDCHLSDLSGSPILFSGKHEKTQGLLVAANAMLATEVIDYLIDLGNRKSHA